MVHPEPAARIGAAFEPPSHRPDQSEYFGWGEQGLVTVFFTTGKARRSSMRV